MYIDSSLVLCIRNSRFLKEVAPVYLVPALPGSSKPFRRQLQGARAAHNTVTSPVSLMSPPGAVEDSEPERLDTVDDWQLEPLDQPSPSSAGAGSWFHDLLRQVVVLPPIEASMPRVGLPASSEAEFTPSP